MATSIPSASVPDRWYTVKNGVCNCPASVYGRKCKHLGMGDHLSELERGIMEKGRRAMTETKGDTVFTAALAAELNSPLDPSRVITMSDGPSAGVPYLAGYDVIQRANELFGFGNWGFELLSLPMAREGTGKAYDGKPGAPYTVWMAHGRLTVRGGHVFSDMGSNLQSGPGGPATEMASKGAVTDCIKRCLKQYGDQFGLVLYDKSMGRSELNAEYQAAHGAPVVAPQSSPSTAARAEQQGPPFGQEEAPSPDWSAFWSAATQLGFTEGQVRDFTGSDPSDFDAFTTYDLNLLIADLRKAAQTSATVTA